MFHLLKQFLQKIGVDKAIAYSSLARIIQAGGGVFTIFFIAAKLSSAEQGYYYTFGSILAIQVFFELGLGQIITQYVAYEAVYLKIDSCGILKGSDIYISRLSSLFKLFAKWYLVVSIVFFVVLLVSGFIFFSNYGETKYVNWRSPWIILAISSSLNLLISPYLAFLEGLGRIKEVAFMRLISQGLQILCVWGVLLLGGKLFASGVSSICLFAISCIFLISKGRISFSQLIKHDIIVSISYKHEIFPYQWKIALSWISGYFIFQLFNPVLFAYAGPIVAGQMGMTLIGLNGIMSLTQCWTSTKIPLWSGLISKKEYDLLDLSFLKTFKNSSVVCMICLSLFIILILIVYLVNYQFYERFLPLNLCLILSVTVFVNNIVNMWAIYLRCHKKEPFLCQAIIVGLSSACSTFFLGEKMGVEGVVLGYASIVLFVSLPLSFYIFKTKKRLYHNEKWNL